MTWIFLGQDTKQGKGEVAYSSQLELSQSVLLAVIQEHLKKNHHCLGNSSYSGLHMIISVCEFQQHMLLYICQEWIILHPEQTAMPT